MGAAVENKVGYKKTKLGWIPEDWVQIKLSEKGSFLKGKGISKNEILESGFPCIRYGDIYTHHNEYIKSFRTFIQKKSADESTKMQSGDILFAASGETLEEIGKCVAFVDEFESYAGGDIIIWRDHQQNPKFLGYLFNTSVFTKQTRKLGQGNAVVHIYSSGLGKVTIPLPPLPEQQKIATILSTWDKAIDKLTQLIAAKEQRKKGLMQLLLTGKKRFTGFSEEWKVVKLGVIGKVRMCKRIFNHETSAIGDIPFYKIGTFGSVPDAYISENKYKDYRFKYPFPSKGDVIFSAAGTLGRKVIYDGKPAYFQDSNLVWMEHDESKILNSYLYFAFETLRFDSEGGTVKRLYNSIILGAKILLPSIVEQQKIASTLSAADKEIELLKQELNNLQQQKKGLMQKLLTGEVKVKI